MKYIERTNQKSSLLLRSPIPPRLYHHLILTPNQENFVGELKKVKECTVSTQASEKHAVAPYIQWSE